MEKNVAADFDPNAPGINNGCYFGLPFTPEEAQLVLLPVPLALAQCAQKRTANITLTALSALASLGYLAAFALRWQVW